ncbi:MAG: thioesterase family protein [Bdellovibrionaceae bacterium]|nr:thioesterase family protein [Pseudobdellovibrionaceae bacterium]
MNLFIRLILVSIFARLRNKVSVLGPCLTPFRCVPTDLDILRHMNNGVYLSIMDLARVDLMIRAGLAGKLSKNGIYPVVVAETIRFRKSLKLFDRFFIETTVLGWDEKAFILQQRFLRGADVIAEGVVRARFLRKTGGSVVPTEVLALAGVEMNSPSLPDALKMWNQNQL